VVRLLRDLASKLRGRAQTLVILGRREPASDLEKDITVVDYPLPDKDDIEKTLDRVIDAVKNNANVDSTLDPMKRELLIKSAQGLTEDEIESVFARSLVESGSSTSTSFWRKRSRSSVKVVCLSTTGGNQSRISVDRPAEGVAGQADQELYRQSPRLRHPRREGILLIGVQGCGKSLTAKAVAAQWNYLC